MKQIFGIFLIGFGIITFFSGLLQGLFLNGYEIFGGLIGVGLLTILPGVLLLRKKKEFIEQDKK